MFLLEKDKQLSPRGPQLLCAANRAQTEAAKKKTTAPPCPLLRPPFAFSLFRAQPPLTLVLSDSP